MKYTTSESVLRKELRSMWSQDFGGDCGHVQNRVEVDKPFQVAIAVCQMAKLWVLQFYYDCLDKFLDRRDFQLIQIDTDSLYFGL